jgi:hypothetical protein
MSRNGSGTFSLPAGNPVVTGTVISSTVMNNTLSEIATALTGSIAADGQTPITANIPMSAFKVTGLGVATASGDALSYGRAASFGNVASANTSELDWYEEGTFTPTLTFSGSATGMTGTFIGRFQRVGNRVKNWVHITLTARGSSSGSPVIGNLPYTIANTTGAAVVTPIVAFNMGGLSVGNTYCVIPNLNAKTMDVGYVINGGTGSTTGTASQTDFSNTSVVQFVFEHEV